MAALIDAAVRDLFNLSRDAAMRHAAILFRQDVDLAAAVAEKFLFQMLDECDEHLAPGVLWPGQLFFIHLRYDEDGDKDTCGMAALGVGEEVEPGRIFGVTHSDVEVWAPSILEALVALRWCALEYV
ncbi:hypothetical protein NpNSSI1_00001996 [Neofusicoccum parvum]|nr:hypothetical protein NpNSSI1_00001996 [Neofusicoccum parvum]